MSNSTETQFHAWKPEPLIRGSFSILSSCLTTMILCVWTAVHLNVPEYRKESDQFWRKLKWLVIALFAPEYVALCAYWQRPAANKIGIEARRTFGQPDEPDWRTRCQSVPKTLLECSQRLRRHLSALPNNLSHSARNIFEKAQEEDIIEIPAKLQEDDHNNISDAPQQQRHPWTPTHSLYAVMGGFAIDTRGVRPNFLPGNRRRLILTPRGILFLLKYQPSLVPDISEATIQDKSKASGLVKSLVCLQAAWFCAQTFSRWERHLAVSLLELNTLAHALCALLIYLLWWNKPLDIEESTLIRGQESHDISAYMCVPNFRSFTKRKNRMPESLLVAQHIPFGPIKRPNDDGTVQLHPCECTGDVMFTNMSFKPLRLQPVELECLRLASKFVTAYPTLQGMGLQMSLVDDCVRDFSSHSDVADLSNRPQKVTLLFASLFYAGIHLIAWGHDFRTSTEALLWKTSGLSIGVGGFFIVLFVSPEVDRIADRLITYSTLHHFQSWLRWLSSFWEGTSVIIIWGSAIAYLFARVYIIVESFLDLSHLPDSSFQVAPWSQYFWHAG